MTSDREDVEDASSDSFWGAPIFSYSRTKAIADGVLVDISELAREAGFKWPVAMTAELWSLVEAIPARYAHEDVAGRLWDILNVARWSIQKSAESGELLLFTVILHQETSDEVEIKMVCGPGDDAAPTITLMLPQQD